MYVVLQMKKMAEEMLAMVAGGFDHNKADAILETFEFAYDRAGSAMSSELAEDYGHTVADGWLVSRVERCLALIDRGETKDAAALAAQSLQRASAIRFPHPHCGAWRAAHEVLKRFETIEGEILLAQGRALRWNHLQPTAEA